MQGALPVRGWDPNTGSSLDAVMQAMLSTGCQASTLGQAVQEVNRMVRAAGTPGQLGALLRTACVRWGGC